MIYKSKNAVVVYVSGGVAETEAFGDVDVYLVDMDNIDAGDDLVRIPKEFKPSFELDMSQDPNKYVVWE